MTSRRLPAYAECSGHPDGITFIESANIIVAKSEIECYSEFGIVTEKAKPKTWSRVLGFAFLYVKACGTPWESLINPSTSCIDE